jgi:hypothetical protein
MSAATGSKSTAPVREVRQLFSKPDSLMCRSSGSTCNLRLRFAANPQEHIYRDATGLVAVAATNLDKTADHKILNSPTDGDATDPESRNDVSGITRHPDQEWMEQQARAVKWGHCRDDKLL